MKSQGKTNRPARRAPAGRFANWMRQLHQLFIWPVVIVTLVGCTATSVPTAVVVEAPTASPSTRTVVPSATPSATATPTIPPEANLKIKCIDIASRASDNMATDGVIVLKSREGVDALLLDLATGIKTQLNAPRENLLNLAVSTDGKWLAYERAVFTDHIGGEFAESRLVVAIANGAQYTSFPWEEEWTGMHWLNDTQLAIRIPKDDIKNRVSRPAAFLLFNPFTSKRRSLDSDYPRIYDFGPIPYWPGFGVTAYNPTLSHVIYMQGEAPGPGYMRCGICAAINL